MVSINLSRLLELQAMMLDHCHGAEAEIVLDYNNRAVYLQWHYWRKKEFRLSHKVGFHDIEFSVVDVLEREAEIGSREFADTVIKLLKEKGL